MTLAQIWNYSCELPDAGKLTVRGGKGKAEGVARRQREREQQFVAHSLNVLNGK